MEEKLKYWSKRYKLKDLVICGYQGRISYDTV